MLKLLYSGFTYLIAPVVQSVAATLSSKIKKRVLGIETQDLDKFSHDRNIWIHCSSLGEYEMAKPLIDLFLKKADGQLLISFFSPSGYEQCQETEQLKKIYLPLDSKKNAKRVFEALKPKVFVLVKYEFWLHYMDEAHRTKTPSYLISGLFRDNHFLSRYFGKPWRKSLGRFNRLYLQNKKSVEMAKGWGFSNAVLSGDTRVNKVLENKAEFKADEILANFTKGADRVIILGSSWPKEEQLIAQAKLSERTKVIVAPHDINSEHLNLLKSLFPRSQQYTEYSAEKEAKFLILNTMGMLKYAYQYANVAFVGGGFGKGLHNILEPMTYGIPVIFGPNHSKFPEALAAMERGIAKQVNNKSDLETAINHFQNSTINYKAAILEWLSSRVVDVEEIYEDIIKNPKD